MGKIVIDPVTRIEGHLKVEATVENGEVKDARTTGNLFRGLELILRGRDPRDAQIITQRICGVCPTAHCMATIKALEYAMDVSPSESTKLLRKLMLAGQMIQSHALHAFLLAMPDYLGVDSALSLLDTDPALLVDGFGTS